MYLGTLYSRGTSILGEVHIVWISRVTQQLLCSKSYDFLAIFALVKVTNMGPELQSQNRVDVNYEKNTVPIYLKFWHKFLLQSTIEIQK